MALRPISPQIGNERQRRSRQTLAALLRQEAARRAQMSRFARSGAQRGAVRSMNPARGADVRAFFGGVPNRLPGGPPVFGARGPGVDPSIRIPWSEFPGQDAPPRVGPPAGLPTDLNGLAQGFSGPSEPAVYPRVFTGSELLTRYAPSSIFSTGLMPSAPQQTIGGWIPLGGGVWLDPSTGTIYGQSGIRGQ